MLRKAAPRGLRVLSEWNSVGAKHQAEAFVIGLVREPCSYYVSLWAYVRLHQLKLNSALTSTRSVWALSAHRAALLGRSHRRRSRALSLWTS